jgi:hypothetical protein
LVADAAGFKFWPADEQPMMAATSHTIPLPA